MKAYYLKINDEDRAIKTTTCDVKTTTGEYSCIQLSLDFRWKLHMRKIIFYFLAKAHNSKISAFLY